VHATRRAALPPTFVVEVPCRRRRRGLAHSVWRNGVATVLTASFRYELDDEVARLVQRACHSGLRKHLYGEARFAGVRRRSRDHRMRTRMFAAVSARPLSKA
jgi:hypothetical protein